MLYEVITDTTSSLTGLTISITAVGEAEESELVYRTGAQENDLICVSGNVGAAYMGLQLLEREKKVFETRITSYNVCYTKLLRF